jgi:hypothetical protein
MTKLLLSLMALAVLAAPATAMADRADSAMRKGIRDFARVGVDGGATASRIAIDCRRVADVGDRGRCTGTFRLTRNGRSADYRLTSSARTLRISPSAIEYRLAATATRRAQGLPRSTGGFSGFFQGRAAREPR